MNTSFCEKCGGFLYSRVCTCMPYKIIHGDKSVLVYAKNLVKAIEKYAEKYNEGIPGENPLLDEEILLTVIDPQGDAFSYVISARMIWEYLIIPKRANAE